MTVTCPACGSAATGNFCAECGAPLAGATCPQCGARVPADARYCTQCGTVLAGGAGAKPTRADGGSRAQGRGGTRLQPEPSMLGWWIAGLALAVAIIVVGYPLLRPDREGAGGGGGVAPPGPPAAGGGVDLSAMTPREAADRLFNRVMGAAEAGDTGQLRFFLPMAIQAYQQAQPLDADGYYHLSLLQRTGGQADSALATARSALEAAPDHLLLLSAAAEAAQALGREFEAREYYARVVAVYEVERAKSLPEYEAHSRQLPNLLEEARALMRGAP